MPGENECQRKKKESECPVRISARGGARETDAIGKQVPGEWRNQKDEVPG